MYFKVVQVAEVCLCVSSSFVALSRATQGLNNYQSGSEFLFICFYLGRIDSIMAKMR